MENKVVTSYLNQALTSLCEHMRESQTARMWSLYNRGEYEVRLGEPTILEDWHSSEICWFWMASGDAVHAVVATFADGERGNEPFDVDLQGLKFWMQGDEIAAKNEQIIKAARNLVYKTIGFGDFKRIIRENS